MAWYLSQNHAWFSSFAPAHNPGDRGHGARRARRLGARGRRARRDADHPRVRAPAGGAARAHPPSAKSPPRRQSWGRAPMSASPRRRRGLLGRAREHFDWTLFITVAALAVIGVINLYSATSVAHDAHSEDYIQQIYWLVGGGILATMVAAIDYRHYERLGYALYAVGVVLLDARLHPRARDPRQLAVDLPRLVQLSAERVHEALPRHRAGQVPARRSEERGPHAQGPRGPRAHRRRPDGARPPATGPRHGADPRARLSHDLRADARPEADASSASASRGCSSAPSSGATACAGTRTSESTRG